MFFACLALASGSGVWASDRAEAIWGRRDDSRIVIDEVSGQLLALSPLAVWNRGAGASFAWLPLVVTGFVLFRCFDIWKPGPVRWAERRFHGGLGVMADDWVAGALSAIGLVLIAWGARALGLEIFPMGAA